MTGCLYETLEVSPNASGTVIRAAYRSLVQEWHPDRKPGQTVSHERIVHINRAYAVLSDPLQRAQYDVDRVRPYIFRRLA